MKLLSDAVGMLFGVGILAFFLWWILAMNGIVTPEDIGTFALAVVLFYGGAWIVSQVLNSVKK